MIRVQKRTAVAVIALLALLSLFASYIVFGGGLASGAPNADLGPLSPNPSSSEPDNAHTFLMRKNNLGRNDQLQLKAYYPEDTNWGQQYIYIDPYLECDVDLDSDTRPGASVTYMTVALSAGTSTDIYRIKIDKQTRLNNVCSVTEGRINKVSDNNDDKNKLFARYPLPGGKPGIDPATQLLEVTVEIAYESIVTQPVKTATKNNAQRFQVRAQAKSGSSYSHNGTVRLGPTGGNDGGIANSKYNFPIIGRPAQYGSATQISVPFGLPCNATSAQNKRVGVYDADNFPGQPVRFRVKDLGDGESNPTYSVAFRNGMNPAPGTYTQGNFSSRWFTPNRDNANYSSVEITMQPDHRYQIEVVNIDGGNTIVVNVPTETIYGVIGCGWRMVPDSKVEPTIQRPGQPVTFTHTATNVGKFKSDPVTSKVKWGKTGVRTTGTVSTDASRVYNPLNSSKDRTFTNTFTIPSSATDGQQYCQYLEVEPHAKRDSNAYDSWMKGDRACVRVQRPPVVDQLVGITPVVNGNMDYIEPTETATFDGYVNISNFPELEDREWGYTEVASWGTPSKQTASQNTYSASSRYYDTVNVTSTASRGGCAAYNSRGVCTSWYWTCSPGGWMGASATAPNCSAYNYSYSRYRHTCDNYNYISSSSSGTCNDRWTCPAPNGRTYSQRTAPECNVWRCPYGGSNYSDTASDGDVEQHCEKRCNSGTGDRPRRYTSGDMNCYQPPSFTLTCFWKNKPQFSESVTGNGRYCNNRDADANEVGVTIGVPVRAVLTANYPGGWSSPPPGYQLNRQAVRWGWDNFPSRSAEDTVRVVGKPTVKILGGDISAGGGFIANGVCSPTSSAMIAGWPHIPNYDASGAQFGVFSSNTVTGFSSAMINANSAVAPRSLVFANYPTSPGETFGGNFGNNMTCALDHYGDASPSSLPNVGLSSVNSNPATPTASGAYRGSGTQIGHNPEIKKGQRIALYTTNNVYISGSGITYQDRGNWQTIQDIPAFKLVVYGANIYIAPSVTELNGIYVAQPNGAVGGNIYTCANNGSTIPDNSLYNSCQNPLTINGVFIAKKLHLQRTQGTAIRGETSEQFNYLPEVWLAPWPQTNSASEVKYDAMISLPPVL